MTPLLVMKSKALLTLLILWTLILPRSGLGSRSPADVNVQVVQHLKMVLRRTDSLCIFPSAKAKEGLPEMTSSRSMSFSPSLKSSSMFSICVPAFLRWELHHAVNVCVKAQKHPKTVNTWSLSHVFLTFITIKVTLNERQLNSMNRKEGWGGNFDKTGNSTRKGVVTGVVTQSVRTA